MLRISLSCARPRIDSPRTSPTVSGNSVMISMRYMTSHPLNQAKLDISALYIGFQDKFRHCRNHDFSLTFDHINLLERGGEDIIKNAQFITGLVDDLETNDVCQIEASLRQIYIAAGHGDDLLFQQHGRIYIVDPIQQGNYIPFVDAGIANFYSFSIYIKSRKIA